jgi:hypothetical protein
MTLGWVLSVHGETLLSAQGDEDEAGVGRIGQAPGRSS